MDQTQNPAKSLQHLVKRHRSKLKSLNQKVNSLLKSKIRVTTRRRGSDIQLQQADLQVRKTRTIIQKLKSRIDFQEVNRFDISCRQLQRKQQTIHQLESQIQYLLKGQTEFQKEETHLKLKETAKISANYDSLLLNVARQISNYQYALQALARPKPKQIQVSVEEVQAVQLGIQQMQKQNTKRLSQLRTETTVQQKQILQLSGKLKLLEMQLNVERNAEKAKQAELKFQRVKKADKKRCQTAMTQEEILREETLSQILQFSRESIQGKCLQVFMLVDAAPLHSRVWGIEVFFDCQCIRGVQFVYEVGPFLLKGQRVKQEGLACQSLEFNGMGKGRLREIGYRVDRQGWMREISLHWEGEQPVSILKYRGSCKTMKMQESFTKSIKIGVGVRKDGLVLRSFE